MGAASASSRRTHRPITAALLISIQRALCQKSDTVQPPWTFSPFNSTQSLLRVQNSFSGACTGVRWYAMLFVWGSEGFMMDQESRWSLSNSIFYCAVSKLLLRQMYFLSYVAQDCLAWMFTLGTFEQIMNHTMFKVKGSRKSEAFKLHPHQPFIEL